MTTPTLYDALEICLQILDQGGDLESCLEQFPELAADLRPILETAVQARSAARIEIPQTSLRRSKSRVLQAAAEMREEAAQRQGWQFARVFRLALASLAVLVFLLSGGIGLVRAADGTLPGDNLYPVKRGWEEVRLLLILDQEFRAELEAEFAQARIFEISELNRTGRTAQINFQGQVENQQAGYWEIAGIKVAITPETQIAGAILIGSQVQVWGEVSDGILTAERIRLIMPFTAPLPVDEQPTLVPTPFVEPTKPPEPTQTPQPEDNDNANSGDDADNSNDNDSNENDNSNDNENSNDNDNSNDSSNSNDNDNNSANDNSNSNDNDNSNDNNNSNDNENSNDDD